MSERKIGNGMMLAAIAASFAGMGYAGPPLGIDRREEPDFFPFAPRTGGKGKYGGRKSHTNRDKAKAARKARKKNRK